ncbi:hypothetical protein CPB85DRAFT_1428522 [Mucidula mucida]|nr:hypothetical protein CPB85DRAFT_1428522 [Mucidula mucida]
MATNQSQSLSPQVQRPRKSQIGSIHRETAGGIHRENSPSPSFRPRAAKTQSMPLMPSAVQIFASAQQGSPTATNGPGTRRSPQAQPQVQRLLPTPPHPSPPDERRSMSPSPLHAGGVTHYPRPINRVPPQQFLQKFQDGVDWQMEMTEELLADIERADQQQQGVNFAQPVSSYPLGYSNGTSDMPAIQDPNAKFTSNVKTPERRASPSYHTPLGTPGETAAQAPGYIQYRDQYDSPPAVKRAPISLATQTPPLQAIHTRSPDKSLPVQEEPEEDRDTSPTPSSDLHPEGNSSRYDGRSSRAGHRDDEDDTLIEQSEKRSSEEGSYTPRSPTAALPDIPYQNKRSRNAASDQLNLRGLNSAFFDAPQPQRHGNIAHPEVHPDYASQFNPDDLHNFMDNPTSAYIQAYLARSPRPDAPIPPTPHSQTNPPSPSPLISGNYDFGGLPPGSPYPYPFSHVRRVQQMPPARNGVDLNPAVIQEQFAKQWQIFAQNNAPGNITESTFTPSATPFPPTFDPWAYWYTQRILGNRAPPSMSMRSSPSHEPLQGFPPPPRRVKKKTNSADLRRESSFRKPPPRVESTQPRETSPEPSSSGEETAGESQFAAPEEGQWVNGTTPTVVTDDDEEWVDEEDDEEDLLEVEYHPTYVGNVEKRRRRWEIRWDALVQAFQNLDRQTDATMVLMAAPSHSSKLHVLRSRAVRRTPTTAILPLKASFKQIATQRKNSRTQRFSLTDRLMSPSTDGGQEDQLKRALAAVGTLGSLYEARWAEEQQRWRQDQMRMEVILRQLLGESNMELNKKI